MGGPPGADKLIRWLILHRRSRSIPHPMTLEQVQGMVWGMISAKAEAEMALWVLARRPLTYEQSCETKVA